MTNGDASLSHLMTGTLQALPFLNIRRLLIEPEKNGLSD